MKKAILLFVLTLAFALSSFNADAIMARPDCPVYSPPAPGWCEKGIVVPGGVDAKGCRLTPTCIRDETMNQTCPMWAPPSPDFCRSGRIIAGETDENGCLMPPRCVESTKTCPVYSPPAPGWCENGTIVPGGFDDDGCMRTPRCIEAIKQCAEIVSHAPGWCKDGKIIAQEDVRGCRQPPLCVKPNVSVEVTNEGVKVTTDTASVQISTHGNIQVEDGKLYLKKNSTSIEIRAPEEVTAKVGGTVIELKEDAGKDIYVVAKTEAKRLLFVIPAKIDIRTEVDAQNGEVVREKKPWWSFLAW